MAKNILYSTFTIFSFLFLLPICFSQPNASTPPLTPTSPSNVCKWTPYPSFCNTILPPNNSSSNIYDYGRFSIHKSLSTAQKFLNLIERYLQRSETLTITAVRALEDCKFLAQCNIDNLISSFQIIDRTSAWSVRDGILSPLSNDTRLYSVSLALFTKGWAPKGYKKRYGNFKTKHLKLKNGRFNLKMSDKNWKIFNRTMGNRRLLQASQGDDQIAVDEIVVVSNDGSGNFSKINDAVNAAPNNTNGLNGYFLIYIKKGEYKEYVSIPKSKSYLMMLGDGINQTIISGNKSVGDGWTTFNSATFDVVSPNFLAVDITFRNTAGAAKNQAVAVRNGADFSIFYSCSFEAYQDTLYVHTLRQFYKNCDIYGTVDFIFGNAASVFQDCNIYPRLPLPGQFNAITAQGRTDPNQNTGCSFQNCTVKAANELAQSNRTVRTYLGRPWKEYSRTVFMQSFMDRLINPAGWSIWNGTFALNTSYYAEFNNTGPGSNTSGRVTWPGFHIINATDAAKFTVAEFLLGDTWIPPTGVPYRSGLNST
ncbi:probable pectinesterase/pectinesterase inhibitor 7 [Phtheirospermum japonicum]|uniref:Pectinesterase n=1 Tax=Phtheirospermum japonicum TaxID=374723 RepID=A0A830DAK0_9LAMI|nr:probable pectinesterase/pectinesterase inhibitor 7 [Phtheirospermum japonicum]